MEEKTNTTANAVTESQLHSAIMNVMKDVQYIKKAGVNSQQGYKFASAEDIIGEIRQAAIKHNLRISVSYSSVTDLESGETKAGGTIYRVRVQANITLRIGNEFELYTFFGEGADSGDKALAKAKTMCLKQALRQMFLVETGEADPDRETLPETTPKPSKAAVGQDVIEQLKAYNMTTAEKKALMAYHSNDLGSMLRFLKQSGSKELALVAIGFESTGGAQ